MIDFNQQVTAEARRVLVLARQIAIENKHAYICSEHILLGIIKAQDEQAIAIFDRLFIDTIEMHHAVMHFTGVAPSKGGDVDFTPRCKKIFAFALAAARSHSTLVTTAHLMLGIIHEGNSLPATMFQTYKVNEVAIKQAILLGNPNLENTGHWQTV